MTTLQGVPHRRSLEQVAGLNRTELIVEAGRYAPVRVFPRLAEYSTAALRALVIFYASPAHETEDAVEKGMRGLSWLAEEARIAH